MKNKYCPLLPTVEMKIAASIFISIVGNKGQYLLHLLLFSITVYEVRYFYGRILSFSFDVLESLFATDFF